MLIYTIDIKDQIKFDDTQRSNQKTQIEGQTKQWQKLKKMTKGQTTIYKYLSRKQHESH
jgi:hypothetical protein